MPLRLPIPLETTDAIIDHLWSDTKSLSACTLVCKTWLPAARHHLFHEVRLSSTNLVKLLALSRSPRFTFAPYVRRVSLDYGHGWDTFAAITTMGSPLFPNVKSLSIQRFRTLDLLQPDETPTFQTPFETITDLEIRFSFVNSISEVANMFSAFPSLYRVRVNRIETELDDILSTSTIRSISPSLRILDLRQCPKKYILNWISSVEPTPKLSTVSLLPNDDEAPHIGKLFRVLGESLADVVFDCRSLDPDRTGQTFESVVDFNQNTRLRSVTFGNIFLCGQSPSSVQWVSRMLSTVTSELESICLSFTQDNSGDLEAIDWVHLALVLDQPQFVNLRYLRLHTTSGAEELVRKKLPEFHGRGIVVIV